jgi:hypothetical protein
LRVHYFCVSNPVRLMKIRRWQKFASIFLLAVVAGGIYFFVHWSLTLKMSQETALLLEAVEKLDTASRSGNDAAYETALRQHVAFLQLNAQSAERVFGAKATANDTALAYARLSMLARKRGADVESLNYSKQAESFCPTLGWQECSVDKLFALASQLDGKPQSPANQDRKYN